MRYLKIIRYCIPDKILLLHYSGQTGLLTSIGRFNNFVRCCIYPIIALLWLPGRASELLM